MKIFQLLLLVTCIMLSTDSLSQNIKVSYFDKINASKATSKQSDFNLKGNVKRIQEISFPNSDTFQLDFDSKGFLLNLFSSKTKVWNQYTYQNSQLTCIQNNYYNYSSKSFYTNSGFLEKEAIEMFLDGKKRTVEANYTYNSTYDTMKILYNYDSQNGDITLSTTYCFSFDSKNRIVKERSIAYHKESTYGHTKTYSYDSLTGNLIRVTSLDDCAVDGSNSCSNLTLTITYDTKNNTVSESLYDATVRNALWSYSYSHFAKYNDNHDLIEVNNSSNNEPFTLDMKKELRNKNSTYYEYEYDFMGNWINKFQLDGEKRILLAIRSIEYYH